MDIQFSLDCDLDEVAFTFDPDLVADDETTDAGLWFIDVPDMRLKAWVADVYIKDDYCEWKDVLIINATDGKDAIHKVEAWATWKYGEWFDGMAIGTYADYVRAA